MNIQNGNRGTNQSILRHYTNLAAVIHHLQTKTITLLDPATWDDRNDAYFLQKYRREQNAKTVLALCFSEQYERYHHWSVFAGGVGGVCIQFDKNRLIKKINEVDGFKHSSVNYMGIKQLKEHRVKLEELPFLKRTPYKDEREYRIIYVNNNDVMENQTIDIRISWIKRITLSPWTPKALAYSARDVLKSIVGCSNLTIFRSTLIESEKWKSAVGRIQR